MESRMKTLLVGVTAAAALFALVPGSAHAQVPKMPVVQQGVVQTPGKLPPAYPQMPLPQSFHDEMLRRKVLQFALDNDKKRIDRGECTDLVNAALQYAGAKQIETRRSTPDELKRGYGEEVYTWGRKALKHLGKRTVYPAEPGMILQFENCKFVKPDGSAWWEFQHHTAIVKSVQGSVVTLIHQNAPRGGPVSEQTLDMKWVKPLDASKPYVLDRFYPVKK